MLFRNPPASGSREQNIHRSSTAGNPPSLHQAVQLSPPLRFGLAEHVVLVVRPALVADEECGRRQRSRGSADFLDPRDVVGHRRLIDEDGMGEAADARAGSANHLRTFVMSLKSQKLLT